MSLSYVKLWKLLLDKGLRKQDLREMTQLSTATMSKLTKGENINTEVLERICKALNCELNDIVEYKKEETK